MGEACTGALGLGQFGVVATQAADKAPGSAVTKASAASSGLQAFLERKFPGSEVLKADP